MEESLKAPRKLIYAAIFVILTAGFSAASDIYVAQNAAGGNTGTDCADAHAASWFNSSSNWGSSFGQIGAGTTVHLCGTLTSSITAHGSGSSSSPITILFDAATNGNITMPAIPSNGAIVIDGLSNITIDGNNQVGVIQSTNNGSPQGGYSNQVGSTAISASGSSNIEVRYLQCSNLYVHTTSSDNPSFGAPHPVCVYFPNGGGTITIEHNVFNYCAWCANGDVGSSGTLIMHDNVCENFDHCLGMGLQSDTAKVEGPVYFYNNDVHDPVAWDTTSNEYHHDGIHLFAYCSNGSSYCAGTYWNNVYIYNNHFHGDPGQNFNSWIFNEENIHNEWVFNNLIDTSARAMANGAGPVYGQGTKISAVNNTFIGNATQSVTNLNMGGPEVTNQNNVNCTSQLESITPSDESGQNGTSISAMGHNYYMNGNGNSFIWKGNFLSFGQFPTWESDSGEISSNTSSSCTVSSAGSLQSGSVAIGGGTNLTSTCSGQPNPGLGALCSDAAGNARPSSGAWDAGAFSYNTGNQAPNPPSGLSASVQ
jgi:hypothetical protein